MDQAGNIRYNTSNTTSSASTSGIVNKSGSSGVGLNSNLGINSQFGHGINVNGSAQYGMNGSVRAPPGIGGSQMDNQRFNMMSGSSNGAGSSMSSNHPGGMGNMGRISVATGSMMQGRNANMNLQQGGNPNQPGLSSNPQSMPNGSMAGLSMNSLLMSRNVSVDGASADAGSGKSAPFDLSDFPALGNRGGGDSSHGPGGPGASPYAMHVSQGLGQQQHDFAVQKEDFPALPGFSNPGAGAHGTIGNSGQVQSAQGKNMVRPPLGFRSLQGSSNSNRALGVGLGGGDVKNPIATFRHQQEPQQDQRRDVKQNTNQQRPVGIGSTTGVVPGSSGPGSRPPVRKPISEENQFGLLGLLGVIRMEDADRGTLALGTDLTTLGLNLNSSESLHTSFVSPWADTPSSRDPPFQIPTCYLHNNTKGGNNGNPGIPVKTGHFSKFQLETLFYIFYSIPRDVMQMLAAQELYNRDWRYHMDLKLWFADAQTQPGGSRPNGSNSQTQYIYFDINAWERRLYSGTPPVGFESSFMRKEELAIGT
mmetsp:Transcript_2282/g.2621  ORF Transcript_2282/g.2621 Transcript_2282/m.2621 type:complete len:534 (+) Transcript_2282:194-1795(+)|eukprot:CAMPEP_0184074780 /NCGR_PEP_ID=MMETSP0957-20130417/70755_1 /TAXON_ID=627963 /ORGANISM="Aplanochytrium sp, Strain PBS07" /LENGTH=533 /DNA_ID=CAMNT_0026377131 /DNA_START=191 /DNA_END=1792 /DNA_ORIENTATION=+